MPSLEEKLRQRLAGRAPKRHSETGKSKGSEAREPNPAAVLIPIISEPDGHKLLLTRRASSLRHQPNDISFPGGAVDPADSSPLATALRESEEEVGLRPSAVDVLGQLDELVTRTGFLITPFVGAVGGPYPFRPNHEVSELLFVPLKSLREPGALRIEQRQLRPGLLIPVYHYRHGHHDIWGITGRLVKELLDLLPEDI